MRAVYTYWTNGKDIATVNAGFNNLRDMAAMITVSIRKLKEQNPCITSVELVTNSIGRQIFSDRYPVPFDTVATVLDDMNGKVHSDHWAYAKLRAYAAQTGPFVHIDNDVILWEPLSEDLLTSSVFFQNKEHVESHSGYAHMLKNAAGHLPAGITDNVKWAYNCGIVGCTTPELMAEWIAKADEYLFSADNADYWTATTDKHSTNHLFEQYFISSIIASKGIAAKELLPDFHYGMRQSKITHLWGGSKRDPNNVKRIYARLQNDYLQDYERIMAVVPDHADVFTAIYRQRKWGEGSGGGSTDAATTVYRQFISDFIRKNKVKTVVDLGCGYWAFNDLIDWHGATYTGIDVVEGVQYHNRANNGHDREFITADITKCDIPACDLLIIKDVLIHWTNNEVKAFLKRKIPAKHVLITNDDRVAELNSDLIAPGEYRDIDITKPPFNAKAAVVLKWEYPHKSTWALKKRK